MAQPIYAAIHVPLGAGAPVVHGRALICGSMFPTPAAGTFPRAAGFSPRGRPVQHTYECGDTNINEHMAGWSAGFQPAQAALTPYGLEPRA